MNRGDNLHDLYDAIARDERIARRCAAVQYAALVAAWLAVVGLVAFVTGSLGI